MVHYRRIFVPGGTYFFTVALRNRSSSLLVEHVSSLRRAFRATRLEHPFTIDAIVMLPEHLHTLWTLPEGDADYPGRWRRIKARFTRELRSQGLVLLPNDRGEFPIWQRRYWEHTIRDAEDLQRHLDYIHFNPVKHMWVSRPRDWPYSSFHRYVRQGLLPADWAAAYRCRLGVAPAFRGAPCGLRVASLPDRSGPVVGAMLCRHEVGRRLPQPASRSTLLPHCAELHAGCG